MVWSLCEKKGEKTEELNPLVFSNGKSQEDVVNEILNGIKHGRKIFFINGVCGTGKSAIALNLAKELGRTSIVVPVKGLQKQYEEDYMGRKYLMKGNGKKLDIRIITGRRNFPCKYIEENSEEFDNPMFEETRRTNSRYADMNLDIFNKKSEINQNKNKLNGHEDEENGFDDKEISLEKSADHFKIPCKIEIKEENNPWLRRYLKKNPAIPSPNLSLRQIKRMSIAPVCSYWCPISSSINDLGIEAVRRKYTGLEGTEFTIYNRKPGCGYYKQFDSYVDADVLIFNSKKYLIESIMNRKPATEVEIIDECDEFLDSFSNYKKINLNRLANAMNYLIPENETSAQIIKEISELLQDVLQDDKIKKQAYGKDILMLKETPILELLKYFLETNFLNDVESEYENYAYNAEEAAKTFAGLLEDAYISFNYEGKNNKELAAMIVTINLDKRLKKEVIDKNKIVVMMSGTLHSAEVLKDIFGLDSSDFSLIEAETKTPGKITKQRTGMEFNCKYDNLSRGGKEMREHYLKALAQCVSEAAKPALVHVTAFKDLPSEEEARNLNLNIMTQERLMEMQKAEPLGESIARFKNGKMDVLYSTKCNRGADFPGDTCRSIIITRFPYPDVGSIFWRVLKMSMPSHYNSFYMDKAKREFLQRIYRGLRGKNDHIFLLSPDIRVHYGI